MCTLRACTTGAYKPSTSRHFCKNVLHSARRRVRRRLTRGRPGLVLREPTDGFAARCTCRLHLTTESQDLLWLNFLWLKKQQWRRYLVSQARIVAAGRRLRCTCWPVAELRRLLELTPRRPSRVAPPIGDTKCRPPDLTLSFLVASCFTASLRSDRKREKGESRSKTGARQQSHGRTHGRNISIILHCSPHIDINYVKFFHTGWEEYDSK
jgi:hypothetical protein